MNANINQQHMFSNKMIRAFSTNHTGTVIEFHHGYRGYDDG